MTQPLHAPETKAGASADIAGAFDEFARTFDAFKETNDERLDQLERRLSADVVTEEKMARIDRAVDETKSRLDRLVLKSRRPSLGGFADASGDEHREGFQSYLRAGSEGGLRALEAKAMSASSDPDGGYLVPDELSSEIGRRLAALSPIRAIASVQEVSGSVYKKPFAATGPATGWVAETDARPQTAAGQLSELQFPTMELYAMPAATASLLDDAAVDLDAWMASEVEAAFAQQEGAAFVNGDGITQPQGFMSVPQVDEASWAWGSLGTVSTGTAGDFDATAPGDALLETVYALKAGYRQNARFVMNRRTQAAVRKLKDGDGNYLWQAPSAPGQAAMLMGFPVVEAEDMPDIAADASAIAFGDFGRGYLVVDRRGVSVLRDPYTAKPYVLFYTTKRVGGGVQDFDAIKLVKFAA